MPIKVNWYRNSRLIDINRVDFNRFHLQNLNKDFGIESRLTIQKFNSLDYGLYNCTAENEYGIMSDQNDVFEQSFFEKISKLIFKKKRFFLINNV